MYILKYSTHFLMIEQVPIDKSIALKLIQYICVRFF